MKFSWFDNLLLVVVLLLVIALAALCIGIAMSFVTADMVAHVTGIVTNGMTENRLIMGGIGLVLLILAFRLFIAMGNRKQEQQPHRERHLPSSFPVITVRPSSPLRR